MQTTLTDFKVTDRNSFKTFLELLYEDYLNNPETWEPKNIADLHEILIESTDSIQSYYNNTKQNIDANKHEWKTFADMLIIAKMHE